MITTVSLATALDHAIAAELAHYKGLKDHLTRASKNRWQGLVKERVDSRDRLAALRAKRSRLPGWVAPW